MGAWYHKRSWACDLGRNRNRNTGSMMTFYRPGMRPISTRFSRQSPALVPSRSRRANCPRKSSAGSNRTWPFLRPPTVWIGASVLRKEDARHLLGHGMFIADIRMPGMQDVAFVRSDMAHAQVRRVITPPGTAGNVFTLADIGPLNILEAGPELAAHRHSPYPGAGRRPGALRRPADRRLHAADPRPGRGPRRSGRGRARAAAGGGRRGRGDAARQPARVRQLAGQRLHRQHGDRGRSRSRSPPRRCGCAASSA